MNMARPEKVVRVLASAEDANTRVDAFLARRLAPEVSRARIQSLISQGLITVNGCAVEKPSIKVRPQDVFEVRIPPPEDWNLEPEPIPLDIVYEDSDLLVINKPRGLVVHPAAGHRQGTLVNAVLSHVPDLMGIGGEIRPGIVHRLDKDTTGLLVVAKTEVAFRDLQAQIKERKVKREYLALVKGRLSPQAGTIDAPIGRHPVDRKKMAVVKERQRGRAAITDYQVVCTFGNEYSLVMVHLRTGRTHQIRVHMAYVGHPVVGDPVYSRTRNELGLEGQALHAFKLGFFKPGEPRGSELSPDLSPYCSSDVETKPREYLEFTAPLPEDFREALETLQRRYKEEVPSWIMQLNRPVKSQ